MLLPSHNINSCIIWSALTVPISKGFKKENSLIPKNSFLGISPVKEKVNLTDPSTCFLGALFNPSNPKYSVIFYIFLGLVKLKSTE